MINQITAIKRKLDNAITRLCENSHLYCKHPERDFTRARKLPFRKVVSFLLSKEGGSLKTEMLRQFGCSADIATTSAFVQQRNKLASDTFPALFGLFVKETDSCKLYKGLRLIAADGSDIRIPPNPSDPDSYFPSINGKAAYSLIHLDAMYDLLQRTYVDASVCGKRKANDQKSLCSMVDRSTLENVLLIADRGYEGYNVFAHIQEKGWKFLIRIKDVRSCRGIADGLDLPDTESFDMPVNLSLTTRLTRETKLLCKNRNSYRHISSGMSFDFLPRGTTKDSPVVFYNLSFRILRFKISEDTYETLVTNLDPLNFPPQELKKLYCLRWSIETSFRDLKYTLGLLHFHAKKVEFIIQELFAKLIMYNFAELITSLVIIQKADTKHAYKANFAVAVRVSRQLFLGNVSPPDAEALIRKHVSPIRPGRHMPRRSTVKHAVCFSYRIA